MTVKNPVPVSAAAGQVEHRLDHGVAVVVVRDLAHIRAGYAIAERKASQGV
jgi:LDH2 family malate/lactate/ureidoglycolate dehydrogenase